MKKMPVLFVGHGNPMNALDKNSPFNQNFRQTTQTFEKPKAILMISAHWYSSRLQVTSGENPPRQDHACRRYFPLGKRQSSGTLGRDAGRSACG